LWTRAPERPLIVGRDEEATAIILITYPEAGSNFASVPAAPLVIVVHRKVLTPDFNDRWILNRHAIPVRCDEEVLRMWVTEIARVSRMLRIRTGAARETKMHLTESLTYERHDAVSFGGEGDFAIEVRRWSE
jgi:hypothetical protein